MTTAQAAPRRGDTGALGSLPLGALAIALVSLIYVAVVAYSLATLVAPPHIWLVLAPERQVETRVAWVLPGSTAWSDGVRAGDVVLALGGRPPAPGLTGVWSGQRLLARAPSRGAAAFEARAQAAGATWPLLVVSPWFLLLGTLVILRTPRPRLGRVTYALFATAAFALALAPAADADDAAAAVAEWVAVALFGYSFLRFFLTFPVPRGSRRLRAALLAPPLLGVLGGLAALLWTGLYDTANALRLAVLLLYLLGGVGLLAYSFVTAPDRETRRALTIMSLGTAASVLPFMALALLPLVAGLAPILAPEHAILALVLLPISFAYAILRHRLLNIHLLQRWLVYGLLWLAVLAAGAALVYALYVALTEARPGIGRTLAACAALLLALLAGVAARWLHAHAQRAADHLIFKDVYDYRGSLQQLSRDLSLIDDVAALGASLPATLRRLMNLDFAVLLIRQADGESHAYGAVGAYQPAMLPALAAAARETLDAPRSVLCTEHGHPALLVPLRTHETLAGHLCLGPKANGEPFRAMDRDLLTTLSGHLAAIVRNVQLVDELRSQVRLLDTLNERLQRSQEEERARLAADLHDEPLQTAYHLKSQLTADGRGQETTAHYIALTQALINQLHAICTAVRPAALDELGLAGAIEVLALDRAEHAGALIRLALGADLTGADLPPGADLVLYRATQEALTNSLRHAHAHTIDISLQRCDGHVLLCIADDGIGFDAPAYLDDLAASGHLGLMGLHHRVQRAGGQMVVTSAPGAGTAVQVEFPLVEVTA